MTSTAVFHFEITEKGLTNQNFSCFKNEIGLGYLSCFLLLYNWYVVIYLNNSVFFYIFSIGIAPKDAVLMNSVPITRYVTQHYIVTWLVPTAIATMDYVCQQSLVQTIKPVTCSMYVPTIITWDTRRANITWTLEQLCVSIVMANLSCGRKSHNKVYMIIAPFIHYLL